MSTFTAFRHAPRRRTSAALAAVTTTAALGAASLVVATSTAHAVALAPVDTLSDNPADGYTLREAIDDANGMVGADTITFSPGLTGTLVLGAQLSIQDDVRILGPGSDQITIDGSGIYRILQSQTPGTDLVVEGLTLANGATLGPGGGLVFHDGDSLRLSDVVIDDGEAHTGGGISIDNLAGPLTLTDVEITNSDAIAGPGGGIVADGVLGPVSFERVSITGNESHTESGGGGGLLGVVLDIDFDDVTIAGNTADDHYGGFVIQGVGAVDLTDLEVADNAATTGDFGGMSVETDDAITIDGLTATDNDALTGAVGGLRLDSSASDVTVSDATITGNESDAYASLVAGAHGATQFTDATIAANTATSNVGGLITFGDGVTLTRVSAIGNEGPGSGGASIISNDNVLVEASTFAGNITTGQGGGLMVQTTNDHLNLFNSTVSGNTANDGGGLAVAGTSVDVVFSTVVDNTASGAEGAVLGAAGSTVDYDHSIVAGNTGAAFNDMSGIIGSVDYSLVEDPSGVLMAVGTNVFGVDPKLGPLTDNGGPTATHLPAADSAAVDGGDPAFMAALLDQRGSARYVGGVIDIGSVERGPADEPPPPPPPAEEPPEEPPAVLEVPAGADTDLWVPVSPARLVDTRPGFTTIDGIHAGDGVRPADSTLTVDVAGRAGIPTDAVGVIVNLTAVQPQADGFATMHPCLAQLPNTASLNYTTGVNLGNEVIVALDGGGQACLYTETSTHATIDVVGYIPAGSPYTPVTPVRFADTRPTGTTVDGVAQAGGKLAADDTLTVPVAGRGDVPADAAAIVLYIAAVQPEATGYVTGYGCAEGLPNASSLNHVTSVNRGNEIIVQPDANGDICLYAEQTTHLTADVVGVVPTGTEYAPLPTAERLLDTRAIGVTVDGQLQAGGIRPADSTIEVPIAGRGGVPSDAVTAVINLTAVAATGTGYATAWNCDGDPPLASSLNYTPGVNGGNEIITQLSDTGTTCIYVETDTHLTVDTAGTTT